MTAFALVSVSLLSACAGKQTKVKDAKSIQAEEAEAREARQSRLAELQAQQEAESRLALLEAKKAAGVRDVVRIRRAEEEQAAGEWIFPGDQEMVADEVSTENTDQADEKRPVLTLYGKRADSSLEETPLRSADTIPPVSLVTSVPPVSALPIHPTSVPAPPRYGAPPAFAPSAPSRAPMSSTQPSPFDSAYRSGLRAMKERNFTRADREWTQALKIAPKHKRARVLCWRGETRYAQRHYETAVADFTLCAKYAPRDELKAEAYYRQAMSYSRLGQRVKAEALLRRVKQEFPSTKTARLLGKE